jgi:UDPglucose 6-dehydrogenase
MNYQITHLEHIGIIGLGFVGSALEKSFKLKNIDVISYDKYKNGGIGSFDNIIKCDILFLCLPTLFNEESMSYDKSSIHEVCYSLETCKYNGLVVIKSTIEPETTDLLSKKYTSLKICHNPEFLTARTAFEDFHNQTHIVIGKGINCSLSDIERLKFFYNKYYPKANISECLSLESESMKIFCNSFYASKIMLFNEYYLLCQKNGSNFNNIKELMLKNGWINPMHTNIPGPDGLLGYGGACFPKDTKALLSYMKEKNSECKVLENITIECDNVRKK